MNIYYYVLYVTDRFYSSTVVLYYIRRLESLNLFLAGVNLKEKKNSTVMVYNVYCGNTSFCWHHVSKAGCL